MCFKLNGLRNGPVVSFNVNFLTPFAFCSILTLIILGVAGPKFDIETKRVRAVVVEYEAGVQFSYNYTAMDGFYGQVENWFQDILKEAPLGLRNGFFVSYLGKL